MTRDKATLLGMVILLMSLLLVVTSCDSFFTDSKRMVLYPEAEGQHEAEEFETAGTGTLSSSSDAVSQDPDLVVKHYPQKDGDDDVKHIYLKFDLSDVPDDADLLIAGLYFFLDNCDGTDGKIAAFDVLEPWQEGDISTKDPEIGEEPYDPQAMPEEEWEQWITWNVTGIVRNWLDGDEEPSLMLKQIEDLEYDEEDREMLMAIFNSSGAEENHPYLVIEYQ